MLVRMKANEAIFQQRMILDGVKNNSEGRETWIEMMSEITQWNVPFKTILDVQITGSFQEQIPWQPASLIKIALQYYFNILYESV